jgi:proline iminopeptidase
MQRMWKWTWIVVAAAVVLGIAGWFAFQTATGPLYQPGDVRAGKGLREPLEPPAQTGAGNNTWKIAPDLDLYHFEQGAGEDVLVVSGGPGFTQDEPWKAGELLTGICRFHYYHQRGCGRSTHPIQRLAGDSFYESMQTLNASLGLEAQVADIERIRRLLGKERVVLAGHSFGALIAALYAAEFPEHVRALIFVSPADLAVMPNRKADVFSLIRRRLPAAQLPEYDRFVSQYFDFRGAMGRSDEELAALYSQFGRFYLAAMPSREPRAAEPAPKMSGGLMSLAVYLSMGRHHDYSDSLRKVTRPVLVIHGKRDLQPAESSLEFANLFAGREYAEIADASHFSFDEKPDEFASLVRNFLGRH